MNLRISCFALGAFVAFASGCFTRADDVSARELRAERSAARTASSAAALDTQRTFIRFVGHAGAGDRSVGVRPGTTVDDESLR